VKRRCKRPPAPRATGAAWQAPSGARPKGGGLPVLCRQVGRWRLAATSALDGWPSTTEPGLQAGSQR